jgi:hypothetical protein
MARVVQPLNRYLPLRHEEVEPEMAHAVTVRPQVYGSSLVALVATDSVIASNSEAIVEAAVFRDRDQTGTRLRTTNFNCYGLARFWIRRDFNYFSVLRSRDRRAIVTTARTPPGGVDES